MLSVVGSVGCMLVLSSALVVVTPHSLGRVDGGGNILCTHAVLDKSDGGISTGDLRYRRILIQKESDAEDDFGDENLANERELIDDSYDTDADRSNREWRKIQRFIKRKLKVPKRYLKKIVRTLGHVASFRSADSPIDGRMVSLVPNSDDTDELNKILALANGRFGSDQLLFVDDPESQEYFAFIAAPTDEVFQPRNK